MPTKPSSEKIETASLVIAKIKAYDASFAISDHGILAWAEALTYDNTPRDIALEAVAIMYARVSDPDFRPLPGLLISIGRELRIARYQENQTVQAQHELAGPPKITMEEWEQRHGRKFPRVKIIQDIPNTDPDVNPLRVPCPFCRAGVGTPCTLSGTSEEMSRHRGHPSRYEAAEKLS